MTEVPATTRPQNISRIALGLMLVTAGILHLTIARHDFQAQVPTWLPMNPDTVVVESGVVEMLLGISLFVSRYKRLFGFLAAIFFICIFPGNISQYTHHRTAFGLDTDAKRLFRLFFQPLLVAWALWATGALRKSRNPSR
jgi:uncharacterized membrane protein